MESFIQKVFSWTRVSLAPILALVVGLGLSGLQPAHAGLIIVSGDTNIVDPLAGTQGAVIDPGNQQFFTNVLQDGSTVAVLETTGAPTWNPHLIVNTFYNNLPGVTSAVISGFISDADLAGVDLFVSPLPTDSFTVDEVASLDNLLSGGGTVFFLGDHAGSVTTNEIINDLLLDLGSSISILSDTTFDSGVWTTATGIQIAANPLTAGVPTFTYNTPSQLNGGTNLFLGSELQPFVVAEEVASVPEPTTIFLLVIGLFGIGISREKIQN